MHDDNCHWYVVPVKHVDTFYAIVENYEDITEEGDKLLDKWRVDGPYDVEFMWPLEGCK